MKSRLFIAKSRLFIAVMVLMSGGSLAMGQGKITTILEAYLGGLSADGKIAVGLYNANGVLLTIGDDVRPTTAEVAVQCSRPAAAPPSPARVRQSVSLVVNY